MSRPAVCLLILALLCAGATARVAPAHAVPGIYRPAAEQSGVDLSEAIRIVKRRFGDVRILKADTRRGVHRIRILTGDGTVREVRVDAETGEIR
ncbi:MAG: hypothetical protein P8080_07780 [Gammaproteobacteria bacterium]